MNLKSKLLHLITISMLACGGLFMQTQAEAQTVVVTTPPPHYHHYHRYYHHHHYYHHPYYHNYHR
jgi:hypothetical protein